MYMYYTYDYRIEMVNGTVIELLNKPTPIIIRNGLMISDGNDGYINLAHSVRVELITEHKNVIEDEGGK